jgi:suppressor for copper-sensitivity B
MHPSLDRSRSARRALFALTCAALFGSFHPRAAGAVASEWSGNPQAKLRLVTSWEHAPSFGKLRLGLHFQLKPGWHVYWKNAGDAGYPPAVTLEPKGVLGEPEMQWPAPHRFDLPGGLVSYGYEKEVVYPFLSVVTAPAGSDGIHIKATVDYLVCRESCIPYRPTLELDQPIADPGRPDEVLDTLIQTWWNRLPSRLGEVAGLQANAGLDARKPEAPALDIRILGPLSAPQGSEIFLESQERFEVGKATIRSVPGGVVFRVPLKPRVAGQPLPRTLPFAWTATGLLQGGRTFSLEARGDVPVTAADPTDGGPRAPRLTLGEGFRAAFVAGIAQLASPAVLALLAGLLLALRSPAPGSSSHRELLAAAATGVVAGSWIVAGLASWGLRSGAAINDSLAVSDPAVGAAIAAIAFALALNLWGFLPLPVPGRGKAGTVRLLIAGLFAAPLAFAWPLPTLRAPFEAGQHFGPAGLAALVAAVGLGLALPLLLGVLAPRLFGLSAAPPAASEAEPGASEASRRAEHWPVRLRVGLGFFAAAGLVHLLSLLARQVRSEGLAFLELALLAASLFAWLLGRQRLEAPRLGTGPRLTRALCGLGFLLCLVAAPWIAERYRFTPRLPRAVPAPVQPVEPLASLNPGGSN